MRRNHRCVVGWNLRALLWLFSISTLFAFVTQAFVSIMCELADTLESTGTFTHDLHTAQQSTESASSPLWHMLLAELSSRSGTYDWSHSELDLGAQTTRCAKAA
uniref:Putative secreted peptide n=1 Tax=Anopheles braziliensis TaxID=58242 RepID=A0A2M3ZNE0_9DIPT